MSETEIIDFEGVSLLIENEPPKDGEMYVAERNTGLKLLTALKVDYEHGYVIPLEKNAYPYDLHECKRVIKIIE